MFFPYSSLVIIYEAIHVEGWHRTISISAATEDSVVSYPQEIRRELSELVKIRAEIPPESVVKSLEISFSRLSMCVCYRRKVCEEVL